MLLEQAFFCLIGFPLINSNLLGLILVFFTYMTLADLIRKKIYHIVNYFSFSMEMNSFVMVYILPLPDNYITEAVSN